MCMYDSLPFFLKGRTLNVYASDSLPFFLKGRTLNVYASDSLPYFLKGRTLNVYAYLIAYRAFLYAPDMQPTVLA